MKSGATIKRGLTKMTFIFRCIASKTEKYWKHGIKIRKKLRGPSSVATLTVTYRKGTIQVAAKTESIQLSKTKFFMPQRSCTYEKSIVKLENKTALLEYPDGISAEKVKLFQRK